MTRPAWGLAAAACAAFLAGPAPAQDARSLPAPVLEAAVDGRIDALGIRVGAERLGPPPVLWRDAIAVPGADYIRLLIRTEGAFPPGAVLRLLPSIGPASEIDLAELDPKGIWSDLLPLGRATMMLLSPSPTPGATLVLDSIAIESEGGQLFSAWGENEITAVNDPAAPPRVRDVAPAVAWLSFVDGGRPRACTGVLIAPDILLTNHHCIASDATCASMRAIFGYEQDDTGRLQMGPQVACAHYDPAWSNFALDVTALRLVSAPGPNYPPINLPDDKTGREGPYGPLFIVQHPGPHPKQVSFVNCAAAAWPVAGRGDNSDFAHTCDTAEGSSGAPVFDNGGRLVGLHHFGFREGSGELWRENRGVLSTEILPWLAAALSSNLAQTTSDR